MDGDRTAMAPREPKQGSSIMLRASVIGLAAAAVLTAGASTASAGVNVDVNFGFGSPYHPVYPIYSPYPAYYDEDCHYIKAKKWVKKNGKFKKIYVKKLVCY
jgi:hypothetical protein